MAVNTQIARRTTGAVWRMLIASKVRGCLFMVLSFGRAGDGHGFIGMPLTELRSLSIDDPKSVCSRQYRAGSTEFLSTAKEGQRSPHYAPCRCQSCRRR